MDKNNLKRSFGSMNLEFFKCSSTTESGCGVFDEAFYDKHVIGKNHVTIIISDQEKAMCVFDVIKRKFKDIKIVNECPINLKINETIVVRVLTKIPKNLNVDCEKDLLCIVTALDDDDDDDDNLRHCFKYVYKDIWKVTHYECVDKSSNSNYMTFMFSKH